MRLSLKLLRPYDLLILLGTVIVIAGLIYYSYAGKTDRTIVEIRSAEGTSAYLLSEDAEIVLQGPLGETHVSIVDESVQVLSDPGPLQICVNVGRITRQGQWLACLPNRVLITIQGKPPDDIDIISQ